MPFRSFLARFLSVLAFLCLTAVLHAEVSVGLASFADDSHVHIVYPAADRHVNQIIWTGTAWVDQDLTAAAGNPALTGWGSPLMSYSYGGWRYIAYVDTNQHINQMVWTGTAWVNQDLTAAGGSAALAATGSALANLADGNGPHIIYVDTVQHVNQLIWTGTAWINQDLTAAAGSPVAVSAGSGLAGFVDGSRVNIAYIDSNQHLSQLLWTGTQWVNQDLTAASGAPSASPGSTITSFLLSDGPHLVYVDVNQHLDQVFYSYAESQWYYNDLTWSAGAPIASSASGLTSILLPDGPHIAYVDWNQHVDQVFYSFSQDAWYYNDLTAATQTASASQGTALSSFSFGGDPHFVFVDANQHVRQIFYSFSANQWFYNDLTSETNSPPATGLAPNVSFENLTHPNLTPNFAVGDTFQIAIHGAPNQAVNLTQTANGSTGTSYMGNTDAYGNFTMTGVEQTGNIGSYTQVWSVGGVQAGSAISFMVGQLGGGTVSITDLGATADGHISGVSILSIANGSASTYSATELDYAASLYYDAGTSATLYEEGAAIRTGSASGSGLADGYMSAPATAWKDYDIQTDHYVVAYIPYGRYFVNQFYYQDDSCDGYSSDCTFGPGGGVYYVTVASIYLGSTLAHQTNVPQDGSVPLVDDSAYNSFLSTVSPPPDSGVIFSVDAWGKIIRDVAPILFIARSVWADQHPENQYIYPLPYLIDLIDDVQSKPDPQHPGDKAQRTRTYLLEDTYGHPWSDANPVRVSESFHFVGGNQLYMPAPNNPSTPNMVPWSPFSNPKEMHSGIFEDDYYIHLMASPDAAVWYWQFYWASGFTVPSDFTLFPIPGITDGSMPGLSGPVIPLMIKSKDPVTSPGCADFASQGVLLRADHIGINGDTGPANPPGCPRELGVY